MQCGRSRPVFDAHDFKESVLYKVLEHGDVFFTNFHHSPSLSIDIVAQRCWAV